MSSPYFPFPTVPPIDPLMESVLRQGTRPEAAFSKLVAEQGQGMQPGITPTLVSLAQMHPMGYLLSQIMRGIADPSPRNLLNLAGEAGDPSTAMVPGAGAVRTFRMSVPMKRGGAVKPSQVYNTSEGLLNRERVRLRAGLRKYMKGLDYKAYDLSRKERGDLKARVPRIADIAVDKSDFIDLLRSRLKAEGFMNPDHEIIRILEGSGFTKVY